MGKKKMNKSKKVSKSRSVNQPGYWISNTLDQPLANGTKKSSIEEVPNNSDDITLSPLDGITKSPGLAHISEQILMNLDQRDIKKCKKVNESWKGIMTNPWFWFKACIRKGFLSSKQQEEWTKVIQALANSKLTKYLMKYLKEIHSRKVPKKYRKPFHNFQCPFYKMYTKALKQDDLEVVKLLAPLLDNPNAPNIFGDTPIYLAAKKGNVNLIKILAPLTKNPMTPNNDGDSPMHAAVGKNCLETIKFLASLTDDPITPNNDGETPIHYAAENNDLEVIKFLVGLTKNPITADNDGKTPIHIAAEYTDVELLKILVGLTENPITADNNGKTPIHTAVECNADLETIKFLAGLTENPITPDNDCLLYTSPSPRDLSTSRMPSSA